MNKDPEIAKQGHAELDGKGLRERLPWMFKWRVPAGLKRLVPPFVVRSVRTLKGRALTREFPRNINYTQALEDIQASASISIIVPIHDAPAMTARCLASLEKHAPESEIILIDDGSELSETSKVIQQFGARNGWKVIRNEKAVGHSEASRAGAGLATRPYLCLLNSDTVVAPWCWRQVKEVFDRDPKIGVVGPSTSAGCPVQVLELANYLSPYLNDNQICAFAKRLLTEFQEPAELDLPWVAGFAFFIRRSLWEQFGGFDRELPDYGNEIELCGRIAQKGFRIVWIRNAYIHHFGGQSYAQIFGHEGIQARIRASEIYIEQKKRSLIP